MPNEQRIQPHCVSHMIFREGCVKCHSLIPKNAPPEIWIQQDVEGCRKGWATEPVTRRAGLVHENIKYVRADAHSALVAMQPRSGQSAYDTGYNDCLAHVKRALTESTE